MFGGDPSMDDLAKAAADRLAWEMLSWKSVEMRSHEVLVNDVVAGDPNAFPSARFVLHYIETTTGQRFYGSVVSPPGAEAIRSSYYCDGRRSADVHTRKGDGESKAIVIKRDFGIEAKSGWHWCPEPFFYFFAGRRPLHEAREGRRSTWASSATCNVIAMRSWLAAWNRNPLKLSSTASTD